MFNNNNIKKFVSIVCTILTLNSITSVSQHQVKALKVEKATDNDYADESVTFDKPFHFVIVYRSGLNNAFSTNNRNYNWENLSADAFLATMDQENQGNLKMSAFNCFSSTDGLAEFLKNCSDDEEILFAMGLTEEQEVETLPLLPYGLLITSDLRAPSIAAHIKAHSTSIPIITNPLVSIVIPKDIEYVATALREYPAGAEDPEGKPVTTNGYLLEPKRFVTAGDLKEWINTNNPDLARKMTPTTGPNEINTNALTKHTTDIVEICNPLASPPKRSDQKPTQTKQTKRPTNTTADEWLTPRTSGHRVFSQCKRTGKVQKFVVNTKKLIKKHPLIATVTGGSFVGAVVTLVGTILYKLKELFTPKSQTSQNKSQINQKYNQHVKNKI